MTGPYAWDRHHALMRQAKQEENMGTKQGSLTMCSNGDCYWDQCECMVHDHQEKILERHWHCEASLPACMPEWQETVRTALQAREALEWYAGEEEGFSLKINGSDAMAMIVARWDDKPSILNVYAWDCSDSDCGPVEEAS